MFTPEFWVLISFVCFVAFFGKKLYKKIVEQLDSYIAEIAKRVEEAERIKEEASEMLKKACVRRNEQNVEVEQCRKASDEKLEKLIEANRKYVDNLAESFQKSFEKKVQADISKKVDGVTNEIVKQVISQLETKILEKKPKIRISEKDLKKL